MNTQISIETNIKRDDIKTRNNVTDEYLVGKYHSGLWTWKRPKFREKIKASERGYIYLFVDGMNGEVQNDNAATLATTAIQRHFEDLKVLPTGDSAINQELQTAFLEAHHAIVERVKEQPFQKGMGTNAYIIWIIKDKVYAAWNSQTHFYVLSEDKLKKQAHDDFYIWSFVEGDKGIKAAEGHHSLGAEAHPPKINTLNKGCLELKKDDRLLFCSHLYHEIVPFNTIESIMQSDKKIENTPSALIKAANDQGGVDDNSIWVIDIKKIHKTSCFKKKLIAVSLTGFAALTLGLSGGFFYAKQTLTTNQSIISDKSEVPSYHAMPTNLNISAAQVFPKTKVARIEKSPQKPVIRKKKKLKKQVIIKVKSDRAEEMEDKLIHWIDKKFRLLKKMNAFHEFLPSENQQALKELEVLKMKRTQLNTKLYQLIKVDGNNKPIYDKNNNIILRDDLPIKNIEQQFWQMHHELEALDKSFDELCKKNYC